ncbi:MAG: hypothetical protein M9955_13555 [Rhizobiaceae bacterium]|nr:hypothetical protein [Rhizobiaceae bacterium]
MTKIINETNFCHIEQLPDGRRILFYAEHDGDNIVIHQVTHCALGTVDIKVEGGADWIEAAWPPDFSARAADVVKSLQQMGLVGSVESEGAPMT